MWVHQCTIACLSVEIGYLLKVRVVARLSSAFVLPKVCSIQCKESEILYQSDDPNHA
jgi:hypothetical protein